MLPSVSIKCISETGVLYLGLMGDKSTPDMSHPTPFPKETLPLSTICDGIGPTVPIIVVSV